MSTLKQTGQPIIALVGTGTGGIAAAVNLKHRMGFQNFVVFEKSSEGIGGTWRHQKYPVLEKPQGRVLEEEGQWEGTFKRKVVRTGVFQANIVLNTSGVFTKPYVPDYPGVSTFAGQTQHTCYWRDDISLEGKRVAMVGTGPSGIQVVPEIVHIVDRLDVYQRTPGWIQPDANNHFTEEQKQKWREDPNSLLQKRQEVVNMTERTWSAIEKPGSSSAVRMQQRCLEYLKKIVKRSELWEAMTPDYPIGCKRIMVDTGYLACFNRPNVDLIAGPISKITPKGIISKDRKTGEEKEREYDVIIWATGWGNFSMGKVFPVYGRGGVEQYDYWRSVGAPRSYIGYMNHNFPNLILTIGPNGSVWSSHIEMVEQRVDFLCRMVESMARTNVQCFEPREDKEEQWEKMCREGLKSTPYAGSCISYYKFTWEHKDAAGKQANKYEEFLNPAWFNGLPIELREVVESTELSDFECTKKIGHWELPQKPKGWERFVNTRLRARDPKRRAPEQLRREALRILGKDNGAQASL
ncbi:hypothetical protein HDU93_007213 [Gonapodya sp. JEL0774]|nr:hypothetical protein HDU93_007213 [Gonapodya sp. JEL0774]